MFTYNEKLDIKILPKNYIGYDLLLDNYNSGIKEEEFNKYIVPFICSHYKLLEEVNHIKQHFITNVSILPDGSVFTVKFSKTLAGQIARYFYENSSIHLERKYKKAMTITGFLNPVKKTPVLIKHNGVIKSYESIINFCKENNLNYKNVYYAYTKYKQYKNYEFVSAT